MAEYSVLIVEDLKPARDFILKCISTRPELRPVDTAKNGQEALDKLNTENYDLLFLDINLPVMSGIEVLESLKVKPYVIFTTANDQYAIKAFDFGAVDYLLKPFSNDRFNQAVDRFLKSMKDNSANQPMPHEYSLSFTEKRKHFLVSYNDIIYLSSHKRYTIIHTEERDFEASKMIKEIEGDISGDIFIRIHKQFVVNLHYFLKLDTGSGGVYSITLKDSDETVLPVGRTYIKQLRNRLNI